MKKIIACISLVFAMSAGVTALAANEYSKDDNSYSMDATGYKTVLIEDASDNILFVDQNDSGLGSTAKFLLKGNTALPDGTYDVTLGGHETAAAAKSQFVVATQQPVNTPAEIMGKEYNADKTAYTVGCKAAATGANAAWIVLTATGTDDEGNSSTKSVSWSTGLSGDGEVDLAIKVTDIPADVEVTVGLSDMEVQ